jgi:hypothetical protein
MASFTLTAAQGGSVGGTLTANALTPGAVKIVQPSGDCGSALLGVQSTKTASFTVQNSGASPTSALTVGTSDSQFVATGCAGMTLAAGGMCTVTVKFTPSASGTQNASLTVSATMGGSDTASLVGVGLKPAALRVTPTSHSFGAAPRLSTTGTKQTFTVTNDGDVNSATLALATITGSGANAQSFTITNDGCQGAQVGPSPASCGITVQFTPQLTGANSATLNINTSTSTALMVALTGTGTPIWVQEGVSLTLKSLHAVWAPDASHVYAVGDGGTIVYRDPTNVWNIRTLSASPLPDLMSVHGTSSTDVYVAGNGVFHSTNSSTWTSWQTGNFNTVFAFATNDYWASYYYLSNNQAQTAVYRFLSGTGWTPVTNSDGTAAIGLGHIWGTSDADMFTFGQELQCGLGNCTSYAVIIHSNAAGDWVEQFDQSSAGPTGSISALWGFGSPANNLYATVYGNNSPLHSTGNGTWTPMDSSAPKGCGAIWGADGAHVWFGRSAGLYLYDGNAW